MDTLFSVLMSVYKAEQPKYLTASLQSILMQTAPPNQLVLVCDGPLTMQLDAIIAEYCVQYPQLQIIRLPENRGLGQALNIGIAYCHNEFVARMDSDDVALFDRCEKQIAYMLEHKLDLCSAAVEEFIGEFKITGQRLLPITHNELINFAKKRNPMNHPCTVFRKSAVEKAGGYNHMPYFEDYDLWVRMILSGAKLGNYPKPLLYMRSGKDMYRRRSGLKYCIHIIRFWVKMFKIRFCCLPRAIVNIALRCFVSILPMKGIKSLYQNVLRISGENK